jgi:hypothetical protein
MYYFIVFIHSNLCFLFEIKDIRIILTLNLLNIHKFIHFIKCKNIIDLRYKFYNFVRYICIQI